MWWIVVYAFFVFPEEYIVPNIPVYNLRWDILYNVERVMLIAVSASAFFTSSGSWRKLYRNIFFASVLYTFSSETMNAAVARGTYKTGEIYDLPFLTALLGFLWVAIAGRHCLRDTDTHTFDRASQPPGRSFNLRSSPCSLCPSWDIGRCS